MTDRALIPYLSIPKLQGRHAPIITAVLMSAFFALIMSGVLTFLNLGLVTGFFGIWMRNYALAFCVSVPTAILVMPIVKRLVSHLVDTASKN
jgi:hypothetical protein